MQSLKRKENIMPDVIIKPSTQSWHARRFFADAGYTKRTNICHYFWVVVKSLLNSLTSTSTLKTTKRYGLKFAALVVNCFLGLFAVVFIVVIAAFILSMLGAWVLAVVAWLAGSEINPQNTMPLFVAIKSDSARPLTHGDAQTLVIASIVIDTIVALLLLSWAVLDYNKKHHAGFIRISWERLKTWKDGSIICPIIEFEEPN